jgi:hypothetical protein
MYINNSLQWLCFAIFDFVMIWHQTFPDERKDGCEGGLQCFGPNRSKLGATEQPRLLSSAGAGQRVESNRTVEHMEAQSPETSQQRSQINQ